VDAYEAWPELSRKLSASPSDGELNARAAWYYGIRRDSDSALSHLRKAERARYRGEHLAKAYNMVGDTYQLSDDNETAVEYFKRAHGASKDTKDTAYALVSLASCFRALGKFQEMESYARQLVALKGAPPEYIEFAKQMLNPKRRAFNEKLDHTLSISHH
jgi:tetratricopeptide (TPR) repeat protein